MNRRSDSTRTKISTAGHGLCELYWARPMQFARARGPEVSSFAVPTFFTSRNDRVRPCTTRNLGAAGAPPVQAEVAPSALLFCCWLRQRGRTRLASRGARAGRRRERGQRQNRRPAQISTEVRARSQHVLRRRYRQQNDDAPARVHRACSRHRRPNGAAWSQIRSLVRVTRVRHSRLRGRARPFVLRRRSPPARFGTACE
jgi:hypothetical protein